MAVKIRLQRKGRKKAPFYHIVVADARAPRDGRFIEKIGTYNPLTVPASISLQNDRAFHWIMVGAQPTDTVTAILRFKGVMFQKHLQLGINKGAVTQEQADARLATWLEEKEGRITAQKDTSAKKKEDFRRKVDGIAKIKVKPVVVEEVIEEEVIATPEVAAEVAPEVVVAAEVAPEVVAEVAPEVVAEVAPEVVAEVAPEVVAEVAPEVVAEVTPEAPAAEEATTPVAE